MVRYRHDQTENYNVRLSLPSRTAPMHFTGSIHINKPEENARSMFEPSAQPGRNENPLQKAKVGCGQRVKWAHVTFAEHVEW